METVSFIQWSHCFQFLRRTSDSKAPKCSFVWNGPELFIAGVDTEKTRKVVCQRMMECGWGCRAVMAEEKKTQVNWRKSEDGVRQRGEMQE